MTATATADTTTDAQAGEQASGDEKEKRQQAGMYISTPEPLKARIEQEAAAAGVAPRVFVRDFLAKTWGLVLPEPRTRSTYSSPEEKAAAQKAKRVERADLIKRLLAEHRQKAGTATEGAAA